LRPDSQKAMRTSFSGSRRYCLANSRIVSATGETGTEARITRMAAGFTVGEGAGAAVGEGVGVVKVSVPTSLKLRGAGVVREARYRADTRDFEAVLGAGRGWAKAGYGPGNSRIESLNEQDNYREAKNSYPA